MLGKFTASILTVFWFISSIYCQTAEPKRIDLVVTEQEGKVEVLVENQLFTSYMFPNNLKKPVLWPVISPAGNMLTRTYPIIKKPGERVDHPHHIGIWLNYGNVNGLDFWNNSNAVAPEKSHRYGTIYHNSIEQVQSGNGKAILATTADWNAPDGTTLLKEQSIFHFLAQKDIRIIDRTTTLLAVISEVKFTDNKEGMFAIRVARELELPIDKPTKLVGPDGQMMEVRKPDNRRVKGTYRSSKGIEGKAVWGTRGRWMQLSSEIDGELVNLVIIDHPANVGYPTYWHARDYGLFAANPLGQRVFSDGKYELNFSLNKNESTTFKHRLVVISGDISVDQINQLADDFANK
jgi:hypothetical protein